MTHATLGQDFQQFLREAFPKRTKKSFSREKRISRMLSVVMFVMMLGGTAASLASAAFFGNGYLAFLIIPSLGVGFVVGMFGDWYDAKYHLNGL
jgi:hypothetical protein